MEGHLGGIGGPGAMAGQLGAGDTLGDYDILGIAGTGGMGMVYRARQRSLGRTVALKVIRPDVGDSDDFRERFLREARVAAAVDHPHVVAVYDAGEVDGRLFLSMQWIDGEDLQRRLSREGRLAPEEAVQIGAQLAGALDAVHAAGLVHRDVKPANVLIRRIGDKDHAYLTDFGVARPTTSVNGLTQSGAVVGTAGYMAPEQIQGGQPSAESDVYALGCLFYEAVAGVPPFHAENELALGWAHVNHPRPRLSAILPSGDTRFDEFILLAMAVDPEDRFASGRAFAKALVTSFEQPPIRMPAVTTIVPGENTPSKATTAESAPPPAEPPGATPPLVTPPPATPPQAFPPPTPQGQPTPPAFPSYGYVTPVPVAVPQKSGNSLAVVLLALIAVAGIAVGALAAAGVFSKSSTQTVTSVSNASNNGGTTTAAKTTKHKSSGAVGNGQGGGLTSCAGDVSVQSGTTSCAFGAAVEQAYLGSSGGTTDVTAYSPVTNSTYTMHCTGGSPHVCTGGNSARVQFLANPPQNQAPPPSTVSPDTAGLHDCAPTDPTISVNRDTTCKFAARVFIAFWYDWKQNGSQSTTTINAYSPATGKTYVMSCSNDGSTVGCAGGENAYVQYPLSSIQVYTGPQ